MADNDTDAIRAVLDGDTDRYAELVDRYQGPALRLAFSLLGDYEDARDVSQDAFVSAYQSLGRFRGAARFSTWLYRIVVNKCRDVQRRRLHRPQVVGGVGEPDADANGAGWFVVDVEDPAAGPRDDAASRELARELRRAIQDLSAHQRMAFMLHHMNGHSLEDVAGMMGCRVGTVKSHLFRAVESLRRRLAPRAGTGGTSWTS